MPPRPQPEIQNVVMVMRDARKNASVFCRFDLLVVQKKRSDAGSRQKMMRE